MCKAIVIALALLPAGALFGQERLVIPFSDGTRPRVVRANIFHGSVEVRAHDGKDVIVEGPGMEEPRTSGGLRRIPINTGVSAEEENNTVTINVGATARSGEWRLQVPRATSLQLRSTNARALSIHGLDGDVEVSSTNSRIEFRDVSGSVIASTVNGAIEGSMAQVRDKPMSFSSVNGAIDVTLPSDLKANLKLRTENGSIYTDFEVKLTPSPAETSVEAGRSGEGRFKIRADKTVYATVNGGGVGMSFTTLNGRITLRKRQ